MTTKYQTIDLTYEPNAKYWLMNAGKGLKGPPDYPTLDVPMNHKGEFTFKIKDTPGVTFASPAFAQKKGMPDPGDFGTQFQAKVKGEGKMLVVTDANSNANGQPYNRKDYHYELYFSNGTPLDPIITNMGCCKATEPNWAAYAAGAAVLLAIYFFVIRPWMERRAADRPAAAPPADPPTGDRDQL